MLEFKKLLDDRSTATKNIQSLAAQKLELEKRLAQLADFLSQQRGVLGYLNTTIAEVEKEMKKGEPDLKVANEDDKTAGPKKKKK